MKNNIVVLAITFVGILFSTYSYAEETCISKSKKAVAIRKSVELNSSGYMDLVVSSSMKFNIVKKPKLLSHSDMLIVKYSNSEYLTHRNFRIDDLTTDVNSNADLQKIIRNVFEKSMNEIHKLAEITESERKIIQAMKVTYNVGCSFYFEKMTIASNLVYTIGSDLITHTAFVFDLRGTVHLIDYSGAKKAFYKILSTIQSREVNNE